MNKNELALILQEGEGHTIEFKENINTDLAKEFVAMANSGGGRIFIGIADTNKVSGIIVTNSLLSQIQDIAAHCDPAVAIEIEPFENILIIHVKEGLNKPYRCNKGFYIRTGANSQKMTTREITEFIQAEGKVRFDEILRDDIDFQKFFVPGVFERFIGLSKITKILDDFAILENLGVLVYKNEKPFLNNAGLLFFSQQLSPHLFYATITCALYKGIEKVIILDKKDYESDLISNIEDTILFLKKHLNLRYEITSVRRKEILEIPEVALREAVVNAACHRDYFEKGANIMVEIFDNRVQISNPGGLPKGLTPEKFGTRSVSRNPVISSLFHRAGYIEKMGTGINRIKNALKEAGNPEPIFEFDSFFTTIFQRNMEAGNKSSDKNSQETTLTGERLGDKLGDKLGENRVKILTAMKNRPTISITALSRQIGISTTAIEKNIDFLKNEGFLERIGPGKGGYWYVIEKK
jgi:ATP-dependent DNA helicase RecG